MKMEMKVSEVKGALKKASIIASVNKEGVYKFLKLDLLNKTVMASNDSLSLVQDLKVKSQDTGSVLIEAKKFAEIVSVLDSETVIKISVKDKRVTLTCNHSKFKLGTLPVEEFAEPRLSGKPLKIKLSSEVFRVALSKSIQYASTLDVRPALNGVLFSLDMTNESIDLVASNGHYLSVERISEMKVVIDDADSCGEYIVSLACAKVASDFAKDKDFIEVSFNENFIQISDGSQTLWGRMIDASFPDYKQITTLIDKRQTDFTGVAVKDLKISLDRVSTLVNSDGAVSISSQENKTTIQTVESSLEKDVAIDQVAHSFPIMGEKVVLAVKYLQKILSNSSNAEIGVIQEEEGGSLHFRQLIGNDISYQILMPRRA